MGSTCTARKLTGLIGAIIVACTGMIGKPGTGWAQVSYTVLHAFTPPPTSPTGRLVRGSDGAFYGRTQNGGTFNHGTVFKLSADGAELTILHSFPGSEGYFIIGPDGANPQESLVQGYDGALYGTTYYGGPSNVGTVFKLATDGTGFTTLHSFTGPDGTIPLAALVQGADGALYGTTSSGGASDKGTVFKLASDGTGFTTLHSFTGSDGASPQGLVPGSDGILYGTTHHGGASDKGTVFKLAADGSGFATLHSFTGSDGTAPWAGVIQGADGALYGTTRYGGISDKGTVYKLATDGTGFIILHSFTGADGADPLSVLVLGSNGALYGTTLKGGTSGVGTVFKLAPDGTGFTTLHSFTGIAFDGAYPQVGLIQGLDGAFYGTTGSTVFRVEPDGVGYTTFYAFTGSEGSTPSAALVQGADGALYGTTTSGGFSGVGTVFKLSPDGSGFTTLHSFSGPDGARPYAGLVQGGDGLFYGVTLQGGSYDKGTVFRLSPDGTGFIILHSFTGVGSDGAYPRARLVEGSDEAFYGTTTSGGFSDVGTVFRLAENGTVFTTLHSFTGVRTDGFKPFAALVQGNDGNLYGTTQGFRPGIRGTDVVVACATPNRGCASGTVFKLTPDGTGFTTLHSFTWPDYPLAGLVRGLDGALYGTSSAAGMSGFGAVFKLAADGSGFTTLHLFSPTDGAYPYGGLVQGSDGTLYGTAAAGGPADAGVVYSLQFGPLPTMTLAVIQPFSPIQSSFHTGQQLALLATVAPGTAPATADAYVALQVPDGSLRFLQGGGSLTTAIQPFAPHWPVGPFNGQIFSHTFEGWEPTGSYTWLAAFTQPGTLNLIGPIVSAPFSFSP